MTRSSTTSHPRWSTTRSSIPGPEPVLTVNVWDEASTGAPVPELPDDAGARAHRRGRSWAGRARRRHRSSGDCSRVTTASVGEAWFAVGSPAALTHGERGAPFRLVFHWMGSPRGRVLAHAGAVGLDGAGVLLVGPGGVGKSSTVARVRRGGVRLRGRRLLPGQRRAEPDGVRSLRDGKGEAGRPSALPRAARNGAGSLDHETDDKVLLVVSRARNGRVVEQLALRAIAVPMLTPGEARHHHVVARRRVMRSKRSRRARWGNSRVARR